MPTLVMRAMGTYEKVSDLYDLKDEAQDKLLDMDRQEMRQAMGNGKKQANDKSRQMKMRKMVILNTMIYIILDNIFIIMPTTNNDDPIVTAIKIIFLIVCSVFLFSGMLSALLTFIFPVNNNLKYRPAVGEKLIFFNGMASFISSIFL
jgi:hypothetical protein